VAPESGRELFPSITTGSGQSCEIADLERDITAQARRRNPTHLLAIPGVGMLVASKLLARPATSATFPAPQRSPLTPAQRPCLPPEATPPAIVSPGAATASSTVASL